MSVLKLSVLPMAAALVLIASPAQAQWALLDDFEGLNAGDAVSGTTGPGVSWDGTPSATTPNSAEVDPSDIGNLAMRVSGDAGNVVLRGQFSNPSNNIAAGNIGTLYYRFRTASSALGTADHVVGLTDNAGIANFDFKSGLRNTGAGGNSFEGRDGGGYDTTPTASLADDTWYSLWMVSTNTNPGTHDLYLQSATDAAFATQTQVASGFDYRINSANPIINVYFRGATNGGGAAGNDLYFDDVWINSTASDLSVPSAVPEPTSVSILLAGMGVILSRRRRR